MGKQSGVTRTAPAPVIDVPNRNRTHTCAYEGCGQEVTRRQSVEIINTEGIKVRVCRTHDVPTINCIITRAGGMLKIGTIVNHIGTDDVMRLAHKDGSKKTFRAKWEDNEWFVSKKKGLVCMCFVKISEGCRKFIVTGLAKNGKSVFVKPVRGE